MTAELEITPEQEPTPDTTDIIVDADDEVDDLEPRALFSKHEPIPPPLYPLTISRKECLALWHNGWHGLGKTYIDDTTEWELIEEIDAHFWTPQAAQAVLEGIECPRLRRRGEHRREFVCRGLNTNFYFILTEPCQCHAAKRFAKMVNIFPARLKDLNIRDLDVSPESALPLSVQKREIAFLREHVTESFLFLGKPGTSKSTYATVLLRAAMRRAAEKKDGESSIWRIDGGHYFDSEVAYACASFEAKENFRHDITPDEIHVAARRGLRPTVLIEEIDKRRPTEFSANLLERLIDAIDQNMGQFIITTNLTLDGLKNIFLKSKDEQVQVTGGALLRRLLRSEVNVRDYFNA